MCVPVLKCHQLQGALPPDPPPGALPPGPPLAAPPPDPSYRLALPRSPYCGLSPPRYYFLPPPLLVFIVYAIHVCMTSVKLFELGVRTPGGLFWGVCYARGIDFRRFSYANKPSDFQRNFFIDSIE